MMPSAWAFFKKSCRSNFVPAPSLGCFSTPDATVKKKRRKKKNFAITPRIVRTRSRWAGLDRTRVMSVTLHTDIGDIKIELNCELMPKACENFLALCASGYYNDCLFHRNIKDFMVQTGDPTGTGKGGTSIWGENFEDVFHETLKVCITSLQYTATWHYLCRISCSITRGVWFRWQTKDQTQTAPNFSSRTPSSHIWT
ncbi:Peptidyl-prolyl cis-trans isomerase-like 3 [Geodia barretti]|uniref:Peptidyl-prolyl cis-trans isomerase n=1 Tax=Geodia barretti TaxID=519541 RepID=A0AA35RVL3_GEOBA|nr:Peptidyl-prolyl cis-trans isomerase-like 3 [Geodia barretti]